MIRRFQVQTPGKEKRTRKRSFKQGEDCTSTTYEAEKAKDIIIYKGYECVTWLDNQLERGFHNLSFWMKQLHRLMMATDCALTATDCTQCGNVRSLNDAGMHGFDASS